MIQREINVYLVFYQQVDSVDCNILLILQLDGW